MKTLFAYFELARPLNGIIAFISAWLGGMFANQSRIENLVDIRLWLVSIAAFVMLSAGNAINDYCDYNIDQINRPRRPLPSGRIRRINALIFAIILVVIGIWLGTLINRNATAIAILVCIALASYARWLKRIPLVGNLVVSGLTALTFISGGVAIDSLQGTLIPAIFAFLFTTAREIIKDLEDTEGDSKNDVKTLAILNPQLAVQTAIGFMALVILFSPIPYLFAAYPWYYLVAVVLGVDLVLIGCAIRLLRDNSRESCATIQHWMKWDIFVGLAAIYLGTLL